MEVGGAWHSFAVQLVDKATYIEKARKTVRASRLGGNLELGILEDEEFVDEEFVDFFFGFDSVTGDEELVEEEKEKRHSLREREKRQSLGSQEDEERPISSASGLRGWLLCSPLFRCRQEESEQWAMVSQYSLRAGKKF